MSRRRQHAGNRSSTRSNVEQRIEFHAQSVAECYQVVQKEIERYQTMLHRHTIHGHPMSDSDQLKLIAKRNAASRIARLIRFGVVSNGNGV
jgi:hypothetical protein